MTYRSEAVHLWSDRRIVLGKSPIQGIGTFAIEVIHAHETIVSISGGLVLTSEDRALEKVPFAGELYNQEPLGTNLSLVTPVSFHYYLNHSCEPNLFYTNTGTFFQFIAWRDIAEGEELTLDFGMYGQANLDVCACGSAQCRERITVDDWQLPELQRRYRGYFPLAIEQQIQQRARTDT
jgi:uncharacterized protein